MPRALRETPCLDNQRGLRLCFRVTLLSGHRLRLWNSSIINRPKHTTAAL